MLVIVIDIVKHRWIRLLAHDYLRIYQNKDQFEKQKHEIIHNKILYVSLIAYNDFIFSKPL